MDGACDLVIESDDNDVDSENSSVNQRINPELKTKCAKFLLTNARSLIQKTDALTDAFQSLNLDFACITETWFKGGRELKDMLTDIEGASGIRFIYLQPKTEKVGEYPAKPTRRQGWCGKLDSTISSQDGKT